MSDASFTGRARRRTTSRRVIFADKASRFFITTGGIGTILAVVAICVFLVLVVLPLFWGGDLSEPQVHASPTSEAVEVHVLGTGLDEFDLMSWELFDDGALKVHRLEPWKEIREERPFGDELPGAWAFEPTRDQAVFGFEDGSVRLGSIRFEFRVLTESPEPEELKDLEEGDSRIYRGGVVQRTPVGQLRLQRLEVDIQDPIQRDSRSPVRALDVTVVERSDQEQPIIAALDADGQLTVYKTRTRKNLLTGKVTTSLTPSRLPYAHEPGSELPQRVFISSLGDVVYLIWNDGRLQRFYLSPLTGRWDLAEKLDLAPAEGAEISTAGWLVGRGSLVVGDTTGRLSVWFRARPAEGVASGTLDGFRFVRGHTLYENGPVPTSIAPSRSSRLLVAGFENGDVRVIFVTNRNEVARARAGDGPVERVTLSPRQTVVLGVTPGEFHVWDLDAGFPDVTFGTLFTQQWYEGHAGPEHAWQSTGATNEFEPKLGLMPLIHGTLKATFYSLLFGVPLALLAAIFTSEFLTPRAKVPIKSTIEVMASLPSVVLGFLAALVIAPFVQDVVPAVLLAFLTIPAFLLLGAYLWQLLPHSLTLRLGLGARLGAMILFLVLGIQAASALGPGVEKLLFWVADQQQEVAFEASVGGNPGLQQLTNAELVAGIRLQDGTGTLPADLEPEQRARLEALAAMPLVFHDGTWRREYRRGKDFQFEEILPAGDPGRALGSPLGVRWLEGGELPLVADGDTEAQRASKSLYVALGTKPDIQAWLAEPTRGKATGGWFLLTMPLAAFLMVMLMGQFVRPLVRRITSSWGRSEVAGLDLVRFLVGGLLLVGIAAFFAWTFTSVFGMDTRGGFLGTYIQRNALVVGFVMGFAIIPIIYTLAEDALSSVPSHLREGSLGAGATPWQTAMRIIVPTAMSGLFSAVMIGLGRAVGETMIVLMAAGNTPILDWNPFNGFRTLSANIAVELPEAVRGDSHYRVLFLNALVLFAMTFVVNTFAEAVRQRFRKRAFQL